MPMVPIKSLIKERCGLTFEGVSETPLMMALEQRMQATGIKSLTGYLAYLAGRDDEFDHLVSLLTINETYFFREPGQLNLLVKSLIPRLVQSRPVGQPIRILSAGCSTGEEPYSIVLSLLETYGESAAQRFLITAADIDQSALAKAKSGEFGPYSFRTFPTELLTKYFRPSTGGAYTLIETVRKLVQFQTINVLQPPTDEDVGVMDIILFRNVSIYFDQNVRKIILGHFKSRLKEDGIFLVGNTETMSNDLGVFTVVSEDGYFYFTKHSRHGEKQSHPKSAHGHKLKTKHSTKGPVSLPITPKPTVAPVINLDTIRVLITQQDWVQALDALEHLDPSRRQETMPTMLEAWVRIQIRDFDAAASLANRVLEQDSWSREGTMLKGFIAKWQNHPEEAIEWFKRAVYAHHDCWVAHYYLGDLYRQTGNSDKAQQAYRLVLQVLSGDPHPDGGLCIPMGLPVAEIRFLCERHTAKAVRAGR